MLTFDQIKELLEIVAERGVAGIELERSGFKLKIDGHRAAAPAAKAAPPTAPPPAASAAPPEAAAEAPPAPAPAAGPPALPEGTHVVKSPIVGTFYRAPSPDSEPYVEVGTRVAKGGVLCIIEAMKLMNEIESEVEGVVVEIFPENAQPVEFGEPLFAIRPA